MSEEQMELLFPVFASSWNYTE